jgi:hypothetical protein
MPRGEYEAPSRDLSPQEKLGEALQALERGVDSILTSEGFAAYLQTMSRFHQYSFGNVALIHMQKPTATRVAGYRKWQELGRQVKYGERGIKILVPHKARLKSEEDDANDRVVITSFGVGSVFDISQTEGSPLPEPPVVAEIREASDAGAALFKHLSYFLDSEGVSVSHEDTRPANGYWEPRTRHIAIGTHLVGDQKAKTLAHEAAHFVAGHHLGMPKEDVETIAESASFVVLQHYGIYSGAYSFAYVAPLGERSYCAETEPRGRSAHGKSCD